MMQDHFKASNILELYTILNTNYCFICLKYFVSQVWVLTSRSHHHTILDNHILDQDHCIFSQKNLAVPLDFEVPPLLAYLPDTAIYSNTVRVLLKLLLSSYEYNLKPCSFLMLNIPLLHWKQKLSQKS